MKNPVAPKWYADPESRVYDGKVYLYVTNSLPYEEQTNLDLVVSSDLEHFDIHEGILDMPTYRGAFKAIWAPTAIEKDGKYYIIFAANDIHSEEEIGGLYIGISSRPEGPFRNHLAHRGPLMNKIYGGAQPIDAHLFKDDDGAIYLYYGGWQHLVVAKMNADMTGFETMPSPAFDNTVRELTPEGYVEAPYVMKIDGKYHLMYSSGGWGNGTYHVKAAVSDTPCGNFTYYGDILKKSPLADGPGHNSAFFFKGTHYVAYHRRTIGDYNPNHRKLCIDILPVFDGKLHPVDMT